MTRKFLKKIAQEVLGLEDAERIWGRMEFIGDILLIRIPFDMDISKLRVLAERVLKEFKYVRSVWGGYPGVKTEYRIREFIHLAGDERSETIYKEHGCLFKIDFRKVYISPTLSYEHARIAKLVENGEVVTNMFAGAGLFSIVIAKHAKPRLVYSIDINPYAYQYMVENIKLNKVENIVIPLLGDAAEIIASQLRNTSDRVLMPYPDIALEYLVHAIEAIRDKGFIHIYLHVSSGRSEDPVKTAIDIVRNKIADLGYNKFMVENGRIVREVAPRRYQVVLDIHIDKTSRIL